MSGSREFWKKHAAAGTLVAITVLAAALRFWGVGWGLPDRTDLHPDEHEYVIGHALMLSWAHPDPVFINYPSFLCYSTALVHGAMKWFEPDRPEWKAYVVGRSISACYGTLTAVVIYFLALRLGGSRRSALLASFWMAMLPLHVWDSHIAVTDVMMTFWTMMALLMSVRLYLETRFSLAALAGVCVGLATGSKYTAALVCLAPLTAVLLVREPAGRRVKLLLVAGACALIACFVVTPFSFIRFGDTLTAMAKENAHTHYHHLGFSVPADGPQYHRVIYELTAAWPFSMGIPLYLASLAGTVWFVCRAERQRWILLLFGAAFFLLTCSMILTPLRYYHPLLALGTLFAGLWLGTEIDRGKGSWQHRLAVALAVVVSIYTLAFTISTNRRYSNDTREMADRWLNDHLQTNQEVHVFGWQRYSGFLYDGKFRMSVHPETSLNHVNSIGTNDLIEITSLHWLRWKRHGREDYMHIYDRLRKNPEVFERVALFDQTYLNRHFYGRLDPMFRCYFVSPTVEIYRHKSMPAPEFVPASRVSAPERGESVP